MSGNVISMRSTPSTAPYEAMAASQQAHIDDLVQKNRTLEHTNKKLKEQLLQEETRGREAVKAIQVQWHAERQEWRDGCDTLQACHRIVEIRTSMELEKERMAVLKEQDLTRHERLARLQRDFRITTFQIREMESDARIIEMEEQISDLVARSESESQVLKEQLSKLLGEGGSNAKALAIARKESALAEEKASQLREENATLRTDFDSASSKLERATLQLEGAKTANAELERTNDELNRKIADMKRQLDKWEYLETKGGAEVETLRKKRIELEIHVQEQEARAKEAEKRETDLEKSLEKANRRVEKLKLAIEEYAQRAEENETEVAELKNQVKKAHKQLIELKAELEEERRRERSPVRSNKQVSDSPQVYERTPSPSSEEVVAMEVVELPTQVAQPSEKQNTKTRPRPRPVTKDLNAASLDEDEGDNRPGPSRKKKGTGKPISLDGADTVERTRSKRSKRQEPATVIDDSGIEVAEEEDVPEPAKDRKGKRKASPIEDVEPEIVEVPQKRGRRQAAAPNEDEAAPRSRKKPASRGPAKPIGKGERSRSRAASAQPAKHDELGEEEEPREDEQAPKPKKRKININFFPLANEQSLDWAGLAQGDSGLNIPTELSPVKETDLIPNRSASVLGRMGSMLSNTFVRRR